MALVTVGYTPWVSAVLAGNQSASLSPLSALSPQVTHAVFTDFDGDHWQDKACLHSHGRKKTIQIRLSDSVGASLSFDSPEITAGRLLTSDLDHDQDQDLLWVSQETPHTVLYWLGNGNGHFTRAGDFQPDSAELSALLDDGTGDQLHQFQPSDPQSDACVIDETDGLPATAVRKTVLSLEPTASFCTATPRLLTRFETTPPKRGPPPQFS